MKKKAGRKASGAQFSICIRPNIDSNTPVKLILKGVVTCQLTANIGSTRADAVAAPSVKRIRPTTEGIKCG